MTISDFTETEQKHVSELLFKRYAKLVPLQLADSELQLDGISRKLTLCPTVYWSERGAHFVVFKVGEGRFRCQFFIPMQNSLAPAATNTTTLKVAC